MLIIEKLRHMLAKCSEKVIVDLQDKSAVTVANLDFYKQLILKNWQIHSCLEKQIEITLLPFSHTPLHDFFHSRLDWLCKDMKSLGVFAPLASPAPFSVPRYDSLSEMLGGWYVLEGSMVGNRMLYNWLQQSAELSHIEEFHFYKNYDKNVGKRWRDFHILLATNTKNEKATLQGARMTFEYLMEVLHGQKSTLKLPILLKSNIIGKKS